MGLNQLLLFIRTVSSLKCEQILFRGWYALKLKYFPFLYPKTRKIPGDLKWRRLTPKVPFLAYRNFKASDIVKGRVRYLSDSADYGAEIDWEAPGKDRLWRYNLHYFQYLHPNEKLAPKEALSIINHWIKHNPPRSSDAWDPFPISLRVVNWIKYLLCLGIAESDLDPIIHSLHSQMLWLERSLERHILANHFFKNLKCLVFAGLSFIGKDSERWLDKGVRLIEGQIQEQILIDGGHYERSPMYHAMILEDCLDLINIMHNSHNPILNNLSQKIEAAADQMTIFLDGMRHPDGQIALFNDAAFGIEQIPEDLIEYYERVTGKDVNHRKGRFWSFPETGYFVMAPRQRDRLIIDCGPIGPDYQPGHSHCDTLSFELSVNGQRVIVDSGCSQYENGLIRQYNRGNAGHNTVTIDGQNQSEVWGSHRCARRARPINPRLHEWEDGSLQFEGAHDGYKRLRGSPIHHRSIIWKADSILIEDRVEGTSTHEIESGLHIHPDHEIAVKDNGIQVSNKGQLLMTINLTGPNRIEINNGWYCPKFNKKIKCTVVVARFLNVSLPFKYAWKIKIHYQHGL